MAFGFDRGRTSALEPASAQRLIRLLKRLRGPKRLPRNQLRDHQGFRGARVKQDDWFRQKTWSEDIARKFFARLGRSRTPYHKAQYVKIQAVELLQTGALPNCHHAIELVDYLLH